MSTTLTPSGPCIFAMLPNELIRDIFEMAAADKTTALALARVSSFARRWTEPVLYNTVVLSSARDLRAFCAAIASKSADFISARVKHLGIFALGPLQSIDHVIHACRGVQSLACGFSLQGYQQMQGADAMQALVRSGEQHLLGLSCRDGWDASLVSPGVTHLRIHVTSMTGTSGWPFAFGSPDPSHWDRLASLSTLTHLAIVHRPSPCIPATSLFPSLEALVSPDSATADKDKARPRLQLILVQIVGAGHKSRTPASTVADQTIAALNDAAIKAGGAALRIVAEPAPLSAALQWETSMRGGPGVWEGAEAVVSERLAKAKAKA